MVPQSGFRRFIVVLVGSVVEKGIVQSHQEGFRYSRDIGFLAAPGSILAGSSGPVD